MPQNSFIFKMLSVTRLNSNMSGTFLDNNIIRSQTLYVHWIQPESPEVRAEICYCLTFAVRLHSMFIYLRRKGGETENTI